MQTQHLFSQTWSEITSGERNEIVFERLNQRYGAYEIRKNYDHTLLKAFSATGLLILLLSAYLIISTLLKKSEEIIPPATDAALIVFPPKANDIETPKLPEQPRHSAPAANQSLIPEVVTDHSHDEDVIPKNTNSNLSPTGNSKDTTGDGPEIIPGKTGGGQLFPDDTTTHSITDIGEIPRFPGGNENLSLYLKSNTHIPEELVEMGGIKEKIGIAFVVDKDGSIINAMIIQKGSRYIQLNNEAMRVVKMMPKWEPGRQNGNPVKVQMVLPIRFQVQ